MLPKNRHNYYNDFSYDFPMFTYAKLSDKRIANYELLSLVEATRNICWRSLVVQPGSYVGYQPRVPTTGTNNWYQQWVPTTGTNNGCQHNRGIHKYPKQLIE